MDYVECVTFSLEVGVFFLLQSFWNYLSNTVAKKSFMSSFEFKFYIVWALASMAMFPVLQWVYRNDISKREAIPQLAYGVEDMNIAISIVLASYAISVIILCIDGLTSMVINTNKFAVDCLMANLNVCVIFLWLCLISIFHSRPQYSKAATESSNSRSSFQYSNNPRTHQASEFKSKNTTYTIDETTKGMDDLSPDGKYIVSGTIEDPYSNQPVMFSMMDSSAIKQQKQHHVQVNDIPLQGMSPHSMSPPPPPSMQHHDSFRVDMHPNYEPISPNRARPSWEHSMSQSGQDQIIDDWLWQSPERRNP
ncbi:uncharacterized protein B0P05DRAFT_475436 [Gilbertella persicaria]|uniref:uncharacterized protein n=1 Tax=Gilbertella persicaria TaxID=101096 RepID=UPI0022203EAF|nr:uncharacterized protein B0P05DRAFT_475436 [Gilbertella persicaria]KAI8067720.1 hypothetical protein B0P05DRAFT_475436 [Gilbertella persicaria]